MMNKIQVTIPAALMGSAAVAFETLCAPSPLLQKTQKKLITVINNSAKALAAAHFKEPPKGTLIKVTKSLDIITGDVIYELTYSSEKSDRTERFTSIG